MNLSRRQMLKGFSTLGVIAGANSSGADILLSAGSGP